MHSLKSYQRILVFLIGMILMTALLSPWLYASWDLLLGPWVAVTWEEVFGYYPDWRVSFPRFFNRTFMIFGMILFFMSWRWLVGVKSLREVGAVLGLRQSPKNLPDLFGGFVLALSSIVGIAVLLTVTGIFHPFFQYDFGEGLGKCAGALFAAFSVGFLEEIFFRGIVFRGLLDDWKAGWSFLVANVFFAAIHFVSSPDQRFLEGVEPLAGLRNFVASLHRYTTPELILPSFIGLFLLGIVLCFAFYRTGSLYLPIGLHAGWVFGIKSILVFGDYRRKELGWIFGKLRPSFLSGVVVWMMFITVGMVVCGVTRDRHGLRSLTSGED
jgi:uncharacterized protein